VRLNESSAPGLGIRLLPGIEGSSVGAAVSEPGIRTIRCVGSERFWAPRLGGRPGDRPKSKPIRFKIKLNSIDSIG
jgi:hypothetical protein